MIHVYANPAPSHVVIMVLLMGLFWCALDNWGTCVFGSDVGCRFCRQFVCCQQTLRIGVMGY